MTPSSPLRSKIRRGKNSLYIEIANDLKQRIASGKYSVGSTLPREADFATIYGVGRFTVREAMRLLQEEGLISRRKRGGTTVKAALKPVIYSQPVSSVNDLLKFADGSIVTLLKKKVIRCNAQLADLLKSGVGEEWLCVETARSYPCDTRPICYTINYLNRELLGVEEVTEDLSAPISALLEKRYGIKICEIEQSIHADLLTLREAKILVSKAGTASLRSTRRYYDEGGRLLELSVAVHAGDRFAYTMRLRRE